MINSHTSAMISANELDRLILAGKSLVILDATYGLPGHPATTLMRFEQAHIPGAQFFDIDTVADKAAPIPHTVPSAGDFEHHARNFGINDDTQIVVYDQTGFWMAAARVWWMFRLFGHDNILVLNGGLPAWQSNWHDTVAGPAQQHQPGNFRAQFRPALIKSYDDIRNNIDDPAFTVIDARPAAAFHQGHIEGAVNHPFPELLNQASGTLKPPVELQKILTDITNGEASLVTSCGSGVTACVIALALYEIGNSDIAVYSGSWAEWSLRNLHAL